jgi:type VI secretion system protein ImpF
MAEATPRERLLPSLFTRLTDLHSGKAVGSRQDRVFTLEKYLTAVKNDLSRLLNTENLASVQDLRDYPHVSASVVNYGLPAYSGSSLSSVDVEELERALRQVILNYEPRIMPATLEVSVMVDEDMANPNALAFEIKGDVWAEPFPERLDIRTELDLETGAFSIAGVKPGDERGDPSEGAA